MHELFGNRFASRREPAWHGLGTVFQEEFTATDAYQAMGPYEVVEIPLSAPLPGGTVLNLPNKALVRLGVKDAPDPVVFGVVSNDYTLVTPAECVELWDDHVKRPVETIGALREGRILFISTKLPGFDVKGDEIENYLLASVGMNGALAVEIRQTPVRVVCANTLAMSALQAVRNYRLVHDANVKTRMGEWLDTILAETERDATVIRAAFDVLAGARVSEKQAKKALEVTFPLPKRPVVNAPDHVMKDRTYNYEMAIQNQTLRREGTLQLFQGGGTGMDTPAAQGTAWGLWNAGVEAMDYSEAKNPIAAMYDTIWGDRAKCKDRLLEQCLVLAGASAKAFSTN